MKKKKTIMALIIQSRLSFENNINKLESIKNFFKVLLMNYLLKNDDAHLKNFGILYNDDLSQI